MFKVKKRFSLIVAALLILSMVLAGCGSSKPNETDKAASSSSTGTQATVETTAKLEPYEINWYLVGDQTPKDIASVEAEANKYLTEKINATIKVHVLDWGTWGTKIATMQAASEYYDLRFTAGWMGFMPDIAKNAFLPLNDLLDQYAPKTKELLGERYLKGTRFKGVNYAIPCLKEMAGAGGLVFNKEFIDKYGFDVSTIKKLEDIEPWLKTIKEKEPGILPYLTDAGNNFDYFFPMTGVGVGYMYIDGRDNKVYNVWETPEMMNYLKLMRKWYLAGYISKDAPTANSRFREHLMAGDCFAIAQPIKPGMDAELSNATQGKVKFAQVQLREACLITGDGSMQTISTTSKDPARTMMFIELLNTDKYVNNLFAYGVEGKHYKKVDDNYIELIPDSGYSVMTWSLQNQFLNYLTVGEAPDKWEKFKEFNDTATAVKSFGFIFDQEPYQAELSAINNCSELMSPLRVGAVDPDKYVPTLIKSLKSAGFDKVLEATQQQFDEWYSQYGSK